MKTKRKADRARIGQKATSLQNKRTLSALDSKTSAPKRQQKKCPKVSMPNRDGGRLVEIIYFTANDATVDFTLERELGGEVGVLCSLDNVTNPEFWIVHNIEPTDIFCELLERFRRAPEWQGGRK